MQEQEALYHALFETNRAIKLLIDPDTGRIINANSAACDFYGYSREALQSMTIMDINQLSPDEVRQQMEQANSLELVYFEFQHRLASGEIKDVVVYSSPITFNGRQLLYSIIHDITARKRAQDALKTAEKVWRDSFNALDDVMMIISRDFTIENINQKGVDLLGFSKDDVIGQPCYELLHQRSQPIQICPFLKTLESEKVETTEWYTQDFERYFSIKASPVFDENGEIIKVVDVMPDMTRLKMTQQKLEEANAIKDKFLGIIAHDLKNSVIAFGSGTELLKDHLHGAVDEFAQHISDELHEKSTQLSRLLENLLEWSRMQQGQILYNPRKIDVYATVNAVMTLLDANASQKKIALECTISEGTTVYADDDMLQAVLRNVISNAIKFTRGGGKVTVEARDRDDWVEVAVRDSGVGMSEEKLQKLFHVGEQQISTPGTVGEKGTGLGLILCKEFVEKHGGKIWAESEAGTGSTFRFTLPRISGITE